MKEQWPRETNERSLLPRVILIISLVLLCLAALYWFGHNWEKKTENPEPRGDLSARFTEVPAIAYQGNLYQPKSKLTTILIMGVDQYSENQSAKNSFRNGGQSDYLMLLVIDDEDQTITPIQIDRDTMADVTILGVLGNVTGTRKTQICLSHGFGDGREQSCELTKDAVSRLLLGIDIDYYIAVNLNGITTLNDAIGGVTVTLQDDFTSLDPTMAKGVTLTLKGIQAEYFVRNRMNIGIGTNESRMVRQQVYWSGLSDRLMLRLNADGNANFIGDLFDQMNPYLISDMKRGKLINVVWNTRDYQRLGTTHPSGQYSIGADGFTEFNIDETAMEELVFHTFFRTIRDD